MNGYDDGGETSFQAAKWGQADNGAYLAYLEFTCHGEPSWYWLSPLIGASEDELGFFFKVQPVWITGNTGRKGARPGKAWARYLADHLPDFPAVRQYGFRLEGESLFLPVRLDAGELAETYPASLDDALPPIDEALRKITEILPELARHLEAVLGVEYRRALIPDRTLLRRLSTGSALTAEEGERVLEAAHLLALALRVFGSEEKARKWLSTPKTRFNGSSPLALATSAPGVRAIEQLLGEIEEGYFA